ncbi:MAG: SHOCT domain-containing protein [Candidatus Marinimicrobia bacterium]|nr:SHOCT domain-containing protein [Candidatus Neomarinimicrobiota bacterium]MCF7830331.1 SHOCT domain-containing protein [Candidatus Neomarinimicrobiota bacterium]MCF7882308.1 SHOCT domain-containing protein [Candidatus Neomarinimicrobiota bacterium]
MHGFGGSMGFGMGFGWIIWLLIIGVAIWAVVRLTNQNPPNQQSYHNVDSSKETPLDILKKRFARGEITQDEFNEMRKKL